MTKAACYNVGMSSKLAAVNPYLRDPVRRARMVLKSVASSSAIEGIRAPFRDMAHGARKPISAGVAKSNGKAGVKP
jgi:hypothetical protein